MSRLETKDGFLSWALCFVLVRAYNVHNRLSCVNNCYQSRLRSFQFKYMLFRLVYSIVVYNL